MARRRVLSSDSHGIDLYYMFHDFKRDCVVRGLAEPTIASYEYSFMEFFKFLDEPKHFQRALIEDSIKSYIEHLLQRDVRPTSINHYLRDLRAFFYYLMRQDELVRFKIHMLRAQDSPPDPYGTEQLARLIVEPRRGDTFVTWRTWAIILWILDTGNRASTVCNVRMEDLYGQQVRLTHTKNKKAQIITLGTLMVPVLEKYIRKFRADSAGKDYLFPNVYNEKLTVNALQESIKDYNHARGVNKTGIHDLRKTYTTMALASGKTTEQEVADRLGHGNTSLLKKYAQFSQAQKLRFHDASSPLNELIAPKKPRIGGR